jgi:hypothetical protein
MSWLKRHARFNLWLIEIHWTSLKFPITQLPGVAAGAVHEGGFQWVRGYESATA